MNISPVHALLNEEKGINLFYEDIKIYQTRRVDRLIDHHPDMGTELSEGQ